MALTSPCICGVNGFGGLVAIVTRPCGGARKLMVRYPPTCSGVRPSGSNVLRTTPRGEGEATESALCACARRTTSSDLTNKGKHLRLKRSM